MDVFLFFLLGFFGMAFITYERGKRGKSTNCLPISLGAILVGIIWGFFDEK